MMHGAPELGRLRKRTEDFEVATQRSKRTDAAIEAVDATAEDIEPHPAETSGGEPI
jgi:hypothetical protein